MREIFIFLKYSLFMGYNKKRGKKRNALFAGILGFAVGLFVMYLPFRELMRTGYPEIIALFYSFILSILIFTGALLSGVEALSNIKGLDFLFSLPIKRQSVFAYLFLINFITGLWSMGFLISLSVTYALSAGKNLIVLILSAIVHYIFLISLGLLLISTIHRYFKTPILKRIMYVLVAAIFPIIMMLLNGNSRNIEERIRNFRLMISFLKSPANITATAVNPNPYTVIIEIALIITFYWIFSKTAQKIELSEPKSERKATVKNISVVSKELKMLFRMERGFLYLLYPYIFGLIFGWNQEALYALLTALPLIALYTPNLSKDLMEQDMVSWNYLRSLPIRTKNLIFSKSVALSLIGSLLFFAFYLVLGFIKGFQPLSTIAIPISITVYAFSTPVGILEALEESSGKYSIMIRSLPITLSSLGMLVGLTIPYKIWRAPVLVLSFTLLISFGVILFRKALRKLEDL